MATSNFFTLIYYASAMLQILRRLASARAKNEFIRTYLRKSEFFDFPRDFVRRDACPSLRWFWPAPTLFHFYFPRLRKPEVFRFAMRDIVDQKPAPAAARFMMDWLQTYSPISRAILA